MTHLVVEVRGRAHPPVETRWSSLPRPAHGQSLAAQLTAEMAEFFESAGEGLRHFVHIGEKLHHSGDARCGQERGQVRRDGHDGRKTPVREDQIRENVLPSD
ncbi:hypothetical protein [Diaminobutyricimonas sp. TR449]|uniref:hypothetical protein n=1 Tax=Diaminobutyricimonas sp. TR449 TaxID=2708076 RepID=UPI001421CE81|nr:hypothetical protein [Diaminobutyricimonas sp. TR449]